ncbi:MAG: ribonuclease P protein component [Candidatus Nomurabacteria bacterium]|nr:MAG: ribonuclease P protein component [Candidatus Nomurabacteria bacterium]
MIKKSHRFHGHKSLRFVMSKGRVVRDNNLALKYIYNNQHNKFRVAVVVSKKVSRSAVVRNRIRRRVYEAVRLQETQITKPIDLVFFVYSPTLKDIGFNNLEESISRLLKNTNR